MSKNRKREKRAKAQKQAGLPADQKLLRKLAKEKEPQPCGPMLTSPEIFSHVVGLARQYLGHNHNSEQARQFIAALAFNFRKEAISRFHHDTIETFQLAALLKAPTAQPQKKGREDALTHIARTYTVRTKLDVHQQTAAEHIKKVWSDFGRGISLSGGRDYAMPSGGNRQFNHPIDNMSRDNWKHYREVYTPWYNVASKQIVARLDKGTHLTVAGIVLKILVEDIYPEHIDKGFMLRKGKSHRVLRVALAHYFAPERIPLELMQPKGLALANNSGGSGELSGTLPAQAEPTSGSLPAEPHSPAN